MLMSIRKCGYYQHERNCINDWLNHLHKVHNRNRSKLTFSLQDPLATISRNECHLVKFDKSEFQKEGKYKNLVNLLNNKKIKKIFHYARFDLAVIKKFLKNLISLRKVRSND